MSLCLPPRLCATSISLVLALCLVGSCTTPSGSNVGTPGTSRAGAALSTSSSSPSPPDVARRTQTFSVLTYNLYVGNAELAADARLLRELDATVVCLQETIPESQSVLQKELAATYPYRAFHIGSVGNGPGVMSKVPFREARYVASSGGFNGYWVARFEIHGRTVQVVNVHLHPTTVSRFSLRGVLSGWAASEGVRRAEVDEIAGLLRSRSPVILAGDFNSMSRATTYDRVVHHGFTDSFSEGSAPRRGTPTFRGRVGGFRVPVRIDYVFRRGALRAVHTRVIQRGASDHHPVMVVFELS